ncbi:hypothetical protein K502DRAFT_339478 [Neoconidiobolus thromboides FSU 785]|nr:hypothetical protein K502DRAFT_339478 [Neoconidiobolus thromboides FSU 785]
MDYSTTTPSFYANQYDSNLLCSPESELSYNNDPMIFSNDYSMNNTSYYNNLIDLNSNRFISYQPVNCLIAPTYSPVSLFSSETMNNHIESDIKKQRKEIIKQRIQNKYYNKYRSYNSKPNNKHQSNNILKRCINNHIAIPNSLSCNIKSASNINTLHSFQVANPWHPY